MTAEHQHGGFALKGRLLSLLRRTRPHGAANAPELNTPPIASPSLVTVVAAEQILTEAADAISSPPTLEPTTPPQPESWETAIPDALTGVKRETLLKFGNLADRCAKADVTIENNLIASHFGGTLSIDGNSVNLNLTPTRENLAPIKELGARMYEKMKDDPEMKDIADEILARVKKKHGILPTLSSEELEAMWEKE